MNIQQIIEKMPEINMYLDLPLNKTANKLQNMYSVILFSKNYTYKPDKYVKLSRMATQTPFWKLKTEDGRVASHFLSFYLD